MGSMKQLLCFPICLLLLCGCNGPETRGEYAATGAGAGALVGAAAGQMIDGHTGGTLAGAAIGALGGTILGAVAHEHSHPKGESSRKSNAGYDNSEQIRNEVRRKNQDDIDQARADLRKKQLEKESLAVDNEKQRLLLEQKRLQIEEARLRQEEERVNHKGTNPANPN